jgi:hypothetical protein
MHYHYARFLHYYSRWRPWQWEHESLIAGMKDPHLVVTVGWSWIHLRIFLFLFSPSTVSILSTSILFLTYPYFLVPQPGN